MKKGKVLAAFIVSLAMSALFCMTALAEEGVDGLEWVSEVVIPDDELVGSDVLPDEVEVGAAPGHGTIMVNPAVYDSVYANNVKIPLTFDVRSFGNALESYEIKIYKGNINVQGYSLVAVQTGDFSPSRESKTITVSWDARDTAKITEGTYTITCTSYYYTDNGSKMINQDDTAYVTIEDYHRVLDRQFVSRLYRKVLGREVDQTGLAQWSNDLFDQKRTGAQIVQNIFESQEFLKKETTDAEYIELLYQAVFDRPSDPPGLASWQGVLDQGMSRTYVLWGFMESNEFAQMCQNYSIQKGSIELKESRDKNPGITGFVSRLYNLALNRRPDAPGLNDWTNRLLTKKETPKQVAWGFVFSEEMTARQLSNADFVTMLYRTMLNREPEDVGLQDWVSRLENKTYTREKIFDGFADSVEFDNIVKSYNIK